MLREIDAGRIKPDALLLIYHVEGPNDDKRGKVFVVASCHGFLKMLGMISRAKHIIQQW
jgi:hypothetical protein